MFHINSPMTTGQNYYILNVLLTENNNTMLISVLSQRLSTVMMIIYLSVYTDLSKHKNAKQHQ